MDIKQQLTSLLKKELKTDIVLETPPEPSFGDYALPCFSLTKILKKSPVEIANELKAKLEKKCIKIISKIETKGPYLNFFVNKENLAETVLRKIIKEKDRYGSNNEGKGKKALVEHTSINPNASPHVGRARNALIGDSIVRLLRFQGYKVETHYFVNDVGKQIAMLVLGCEGKKNAAFDKLLNIYIDINKKMDKEIENKVFELLHKLEQGDKAVRDKFRKIVSICVKGQTGILNELGIKYDHFDYESDYLWSKKTDEILKKLEKTNKLFTDEQGRKVLEQKEFNLAMKSPFLVLTRADGTSLYPLRDIAYTIYKVNKGHEKNILILGEDQKLYFEQLKAALSLLKQEAPSVIHYSFVLLAEGKMSTRKGNLVLLEDFMKEALDKAKKELKKRYGKIDEKTAKSIAYSAIKYGILRVSAEKNVLFDWQHAINFEGESGPYCQYAYARICSIVRKYGKKVNAKVDFELLKEPTEIGLIKHLAEFPNIANQLKPHSIANYAVNLAEKLNEFYHACNVLKAEEELKKARLVLISCIKQVLGISLSLLGIEVLERM